MAAKLQNKEVILDLSMGAFTNIVYENIHNQNKTILEKVIKPVMPVLTKCNISTTENSPSLQKKLLLDLIKGKRMLKDDLEKIIIAIAGNFMNLVEMARALGKNYIPFWEHMLSFNGVSLAYAEEITKFSIEQIEDYSSWYNHYNSSDIFFCYLKMQSARYSRNYKNTTFLFIPPRIRSLISLHLYGSSYMDIPVVKEIDGSGQLVMESHENDFIKDYFYFDGLKLSSMLPEAAEAYPVTKVDKLIKKITTPGFSEACSHGNVQRHRLEALAYLFYVYRMSYYRKDYAQDSPEEMARFTVNKFANNLSSSSFQTMLPQFKGFTKSWTANNKASKFCDLVNSIIKESKGEWIDMHNFLHNYIYNLGMNSDPYIYYNDYKPYVEYNNLFSGSSLEKANLKMADPNDWLDEYNVWKDLSRPFILNYIKLLCAIGCVELALVPDPADDEMEGIRYLRLTDLGKYALEITKKYTAPTQSGIGEFDIDMVNPIIYAHEKNSPYQIFLSQIGTTAGTSRYVVSVKSLLKGCTRQEEVHKRIDTFKKLFMPTPEGIWKEILEEAHMRCNILLSNNTEYVFYPLNPDVPGLIDYISTEEKMKGKIIKCENYIILVPSDFESKFKNLLAKAGYIV